MIDGPGVLAVHRDKPAEVLWRDGIVVRNDLSGNPVVEPEFVVARRLVGPLLVEPRVDEVEAGLELMAAREPVRPVITESAFRRIPVTVNRAPVAGCIARTH